MKVGEHAPPCVPSHGAYWERQTDPFHISAIFPAVEQSGMRIANPEVLNHGQVRNGWMLIDWCENPIGWIPDGTEIQDHEQRFDLELGPYGRMVARPRAMCAACNGTGAEFPGNPWTLKCDECGGSGKEPKR